MDGTIIRSDFDVGRCFRLEIKNLPNGCYFLRVKGKDINYTFKFIKH